MSEIKDTVSTKSESKTSEAPHIKENNPSNDQTVVRQFYQHKEDRAGLVFKFWKVFSVDFFFLPFQVGLMIIPGIWGIVLNGIAGLAHLIVLGFVIYIFLRKLTKDFGN